MLKMKLLLVALLIGFGCLVLAEDRDAYVEEISKAYGNLEHDRKEVFDRYMKEFKDLKTEKEQLVWLANMNKDDPDIFEVWMIGNPSDLYSGRRPAKKYMKYYYDRIAEMEDGTEDEYNKFIKDVFRKWLKLGKSTKEELSKKFSLAKVFLGLETPFNKAYYKLPTEQQEIYDDVADHGKTYLKLILASVQLHKDHPDLFEVLQLKFKDNVANFTGSKDAKEFVNDFYLSISDIKDDSDQEMEKFHKITSEKWNNLEYDVQKEIGEHDSALKRYIRGPYDEYDEAIKKLSLDQQKEYKSYTDKFLKLLYGGEIQQLVKMRLKHPEFYDIQKLFISKAIERINNEEGQQFVKNYYDQAGKMSDDTNSSFAKFIRKTKAKWNKLSEGAQDEVLDLPLDSTKEREKLSTSQQDKYDSYFENFKFKSSLNYEALIRIAVKMRINDPELFEKVLKVLLRNKVRFTTHGRKVRDFLAYFFGRAEQLESDSDADFLAFKKDINEKWSKLDQKEKDQLLNKRTNFGTLFKSD